MTEDAEKLLAQLNTLHWNDRLEVAALLVDALIRDYRHLKSENAAMQRRLVLLEQQVHKPDVVWTSYEKRAEHD